MRISLYRNVYEVNPIKSTSIFKVFDSIKNGTYKNQISNLRAEFDEKKQAKIKEALINFTPTGTFVTRNNQSLKTSSGLACVDFDKLENPEKALELKEKLNQDKYTFSSFISGRAKGVKVFVKIPLVDNQEDYSDYYVKIQEHFNQYHPTDGAYKSIQMPCSVSFDEDLFINENSEVFFDKYIRPLEPQREIINIPLNDQNEIANKLEVWFKKRWTGLNRNTNLHAYARQMNAFGVDKETCLNYLLPYENSDFKSREIKLLIESAYKYKEEFNTRFFEDKKKINNMKNLIISGKNLDNIKANFKEIKDENLILEYEKHKKELTEDSFWYFDENNRIKLATFRFLNYLEYNNISKYYPDKKSSVFNYIKKDENFVSLFGESKIKDFVLNDLRQRGEIEAFELMANNTANFSTNFLSMIKTTDIVLNKDDKDTAYLYYKNHAVKITKENIEILDYKKIENFIWKEQVINREIFLSNESDGVFRKFIWLVSGQNKDRYYTLKSVIGYLLHSYQNLAKPKCVVFNDEMLSDDIANGGSGKGLINLALGFIKNMVIEDGKKWDSKSQFAYQKVNKDTQIFFIDDVVKNFDFEQLFSVITNGMSVEKKGQDPFKIDFVDSPKITISTNYTIKGEGPSFNRRIFEVEIANYFNDTHTPFDEFKHDLFTEWNKEEWANFDNYMVRCVQYYLKYGLVESKKINLDLRKLINNLGAEFIEFMESKPLKELKYKKEVRDEFNRLYPNIAKYNTAQKFNAKVKEYCKFYNLNLIETKYNGLDNWKIEYKDIVDTTETDLPF